MTCKGKKLFKHAIIMAEWSVVTVLNSDNGGEQQYVMPTCSPILKLLRGLPDPNDNSMMTRHHLEYVTQTALPFHAHGVGALRIMYILAVQHAMHRALTRVLDLPRGVPLRLAAAEHDVRVSVGTVWIVNPSVPGLDCLWLAEGVTPDAMVDALTLVPELVAVKGRCMYALERMFWAYIVTLQRRWRKKLAWRHQRLLPPDESAGWPGGIEYHKALRRFGANAKGSGGTGC